MSPPTVVLITGAGRGIGKAIATTYLSFPGHVVIGALRDPKSTQAEQLRSFPVASGSRLLLVGIENRNILDPKTAVEEIKAAGIDHVDIVIANSAISTGSGPLDAVDPKVFTESFNINVVSGLVLFQAVHKLLTRSSAPKWVSISSRGGSIGAPLPWYPYAAAYCMSKAAQNFFSQTLHVGYQSLTAFALHPGFVATDMGIAAAVASGIDLPKTSSEESAKNIIHLIDQATRESASGKFFDVDTREELPW